MAQVSSRFVPILALSLIAACAPMSRAEEAPATEFPKGATWIQSEPLTFKDLKDRVVIVHFWTFGCINCQRNYPVYKDWLKQYADQPVTIIGVHTPEFDGEKVIDTVRDRAKTNGLKFPIVIDNDSAIWKAWNIRYWPTILLIDRKGVVRYYWEGELHPEKPADKVFAKRIDELLAEKK